jgi:hypothetical protein
MAATITIDADTRGALDGLDRIDGRLDNVRRQLLRTEGAAQGLGAARITAFASSISAAGAAFDMVSRATDFARASLQAFFESSAEGKAIWEQIDMQFKSALGTIGELILGTSDVAEAGELVRDVMGDVTAVIRGVGSAMEPLISVMRTGLLGVLDAVATMFGKAKDEADEYAAATARVAAELRELDQLTSTYDQTLVEAVQGTDDYQVKLNKLEEIAGLAADQLLALVDAEYGLVQQGQITERQLQSNASTIDVVEAAYADLRRQIMDAIVAGDDLDRGFGAVAEEANALGSAIAQVQIGNLADELQRLNVIVGTQSLPFFEVFGQVVADLQAIIEGDGDTPEPPGPTAPALRNQIELLDELTKAQQRAKVEAREQVEAQRAFYEQLYQQGLERGQAAREQYEAEQQAAQEREEALNAIAERAAQERLAIQAEEHRQQQAADAAAQAARQSIFASVGGAMAGLIQAEGDAMTRVRKVLGQELVARGQAALAQAAIMAATLNPAAAGVAAAGLGAIALGKRFGAGGGGMGAGRGGGGGGRSATVTQNITFAGAAAGQDTRAIAAAIGRASRDGVLEGMA